MPPPKVAAPPEAGAYLTDGVSLVEVLAIDDDGNYHVLDTAVALDAPTMKLTVLEVQQMWREVERG